MSLTQSEYYVEVKEGDKVKIVPHTKKGGHYLFLTRGSAVKFLNTLVENNPNNTFRLVKTATTYTEEKWLTSNTNRR